jgi:hypothetical protein
VSAGSLSDFLLCPTTRAALLCAGLKGRREDRSVVEGGVKSLRRSDPPSESGMKEQYKTSA